MKLLILINTFSGRLKYVDKIEYIKKELKKVYDIVDVFKNSEDQSIDDYLKSNITFYDVIVIMGGDGTIHKVVNILMKYDNRPNIAFIPSGTCNDTANTFGYKNLANSLKNIKKNLAVDATLYSLNDNYFIYGTAAGGISSVSYNTDTLSKRKMGRFAYYFHTLKLIHKSKEMNLRVEYNNKVIEDKFYLFLATSSRYLAGIKLADRTLNKGLKVVLFKNRLKLFGLIDFARYVFLGRLFKDDLSFYTDKLKITSKEVIDYNADGELVTSTNEVEINTIPNSISVITNKKIKKKYYHEK